MSNSIIILRFLITCSNSIIAITVCFVYRNGCATTSCSRFHPASSLLIAEQVKHDDRNCQRITSLLFAKKLTLARSSKVKINASTIHRTMNRITLACLASLALLAGGLVALSWYRGRRPEGRRRVRKTFAQEVKEEAPGEQLA
jgi:hypothetical protein